MRHLKDIDISNSFHRNAMIVPREIPKRQDKVQKALVLVAGYGTRFLPTTKAIPKEMLPLVDKPVIQYLVEEAIKSGINQVIFVASRNKRSLEDHFDRMPELESFLRRSEEHTSELSHSAKSRMPSSA